MNAAKTEAEAFLKLQEAATPGEWKASKSTKRYYTIGSDAKRPCIVRRKPNWFRHRVATVQVGEFVSDEEIVGNAALITAARNTALPRLTLEVVAECENLAAENERLREDIKQFQDAVKSFADAWHEATVQAAQEDSEVYRVKMPMESATWHKIAIAYARSRVPAEQRPLLAELEQKLGLALQEPTR